MPKLADRRPLIGLCVMYPSPGVVERVGGDWDFIWIDGQHGEMGYQDVLSLVRASDLAGAAPLVRVPWLEAGAIGKALDTAAAGVIVPCVDSVEEAKAAVQAAKFPPIGRRSYGGRRPIDRLGRTYSDFANTDQLLIVQIESPQAMEQAEAIAAVEGVDALFLGPDDIMLRRGYSMTTPRSRETLGQDVKALADAAHAHQKLAMGVAIGQEMLELHLSLGYDLLVAGSEVMFLANSSKAAASEARAAIAGRALPQSDTLRAAGPY